MDDINPSALTAPIKRDYHLSDAAIQQRSLAARQPRSRRKAAVLEIVEEALSTQFREALIRYSAKILKKQCERCTLMKKCRMNKRA